MQTGVRISLGVRGVWLLMAGLCLYPLLVFAETRSPVSYTFTKIVDTTAGRFHSLSRAPVIDNHGRVIFWATLAEGGQGIYIGDGRTLETVSDTVNGLSELGRHPTMSLSGNVAFLALYEDGAAEYVLGLKQAGPVFLKTKGLDSLGDIAVNDAGMAAFKAKKVKGRERRPQIFLAKQGKPRLVPKSAHSHMGPVSINNLGHMTFSDGKRVFRSDGMTTTPVKNLGKAYLLFSRPVINDLGKIVVQAAKKVTPDLFENQILVLDGEKVEVVATTSGHFQSFFSLHAMNASGQIVFNAGLPSGFIGLFTGANPETDMVLTNREKLDGRVIAADGGPVTSNRGLNDAGQIVFFVQLADGSEGIYRADPASP